MGTQMLVGVGSDLVEFGRIWLDRLTGVMGSSNGLMVEVASKGGFTR